MRALILGRKYVLAGAAALAALASMGTAHARSFTVLHAFRGGKDGAAPSAGLIDDSAGNLYGTTYAGGGGAHCRNGCGTVFKLAPDGAETVLHTFTNKNGDGAWPAAGLIEDSAGNLYGTTEGGGGAANAGTVFELAPDGAETVLYAFTGGSDGSSPGATPTRDKVGNLYGTTFLGGDKDCNQGVGCGTIFRLAPDGAETVLHAFAGGSDGANPAAGLIRDEGDNLYGTTMAGGGEGCSGNGCGTVFEIAADRTETVLYAFAGGSDGANPGAALTKDKADNFYGTTEFGGKYGAGTVFKLAPDGTETVLYSFTGGRDGNWPLASLIEDRTGNLYGATALGGNLNCALDKYGCGTVFKLSPDGTEQVLYAFRGRKDGFFPRARLIKDRTRSTLWHGIGRWRRWRHRVQSQEVSEPRALSGVRSDEPNAFGYLFPDAEPVARFAEEYSDANGPRTNLLAEKDPGTP